MALLHHKFIRRHAFLAARGAQILITDPFSRQGRYRLTRVAKELDWDKLYPQAPKRDIEELTPGTEDVTLASLKFEYFNTEFYELFCIARLIRHIAPENAFEFGTFDGRSTLNIALNLPENGQITTFDLPPDQISYAARTQIGKRFRDHPIAHRIKQLHGNTASFDFSPQHGQYDFIFIDADHSYENVSRDTDNALKLADPNGSIILWHDYANHKGVQRTLDERLHNDPRFRNLTWIDQTSMAILEIGSRHRLINAAEHRAAA